MTRGWSRYFPLLLRRDEVKDAHLSPVQAALEHSVSVQLSLKVLLSARHTRKKQKKQRKNTKAISTIGHVIVVFFMHRNLSAQSSKMLQFASVRIQLH